jgi:hypothetical protein
MCRSLDGIHQLKQLRIALIERVQALERIVCPSPNDHSDLYNLRASLRKAQGDQDDMRTNMMRLKVELERALTPEQPRVEPVGGVYRASIQVKIEAMRRCLCTHMMVHACMYAHVPHGSRHS